MKKLKGVFAVFCALVLFGLVGYVSVKPQKTQVDQDIEGVPYYENEDSCGLLFTFSEGGSVFINLDFYNKQTLLMFFDQKVEPLSLRTYGYGVTHSFSADYSFLSKLIDRFGGITLKREGFVRLTGVQVTDMLSTSLERSLKREIATELFSKISSVGLDKKDLIFIIENTQTEMSFPEGYDLLDAINEIIGEVYFIN